MGNLEDINFTEDPKDLYDSISGLKEGIDNDSVSSSQVQALLNLLATEAKGGVRYCSPGC